MFTAKDYKSDQYVRWCPGCGDHAVLNSLHKAMAELGIPPHQIAVISGIGCSSRLPHYMNTYGFNTIHGRGAAIASGVKIAHPELTVWQASGDGDCFAIGGNHFIHACRRNVNVNVLVFNNRIYGLTKGQYSPTSPKGFVSKSSPFGTVERPFRPAELVLGARGTFFARTLDVDQPTSLMVMKAAAMHKGYSVCECLTNCVIFNNGAHSTISDRATKADRTIVLRHGEKMIFGKDRNKGLVLDGLKLKVVTIGEKGITEDDILTHDAHEDNIGIHTMLADMKYPEYPVALGVIRDVADVTYDGGVRMQAEQVTAKAKIHCVDDLLRSGSTWEVK